MSKNKEEKIENPFEAFDILKGNFVPPANEDDDLETGDPDLIQDDVDDTDDLEDDKLKAGDDALKKVIEQQAKANSTKIEDDEDSDDTDDSIKDDNNNQTNGFLDAIKDLSEKGILEVSTDEIEDSEEGFQKAIEQTVNNKIKQRVGEFGDEALAFLSFIENGGNPKDFLTVYYGNQTWSDFNIETEASQKAAIRESLKLAGESPEDIEDLITEFEDNGTLEKRAKSALNKLVKFEETEKQRVLEEQKLKAEQEKAANQKYWNDFKADLEKKEDIKGFKVTPKVKDELWKFMTVTDKTGKTAYQKAVEENKDSSLLFAYMAMNNFDISKLEKQVESKVSSKIAGIIKNYKSDSKDKISSGRTHVEKDGDDPFALFGKI